MAVLPMMTMMITTLLTQIIEMWVQRQLNVTIKSKVVPVLNHEDVW
jgi:hypothetical protein